MKKYYIILLYLSGMVTLHAQVGINTETPKVTMHVIPSKTDGTTAEGIIAPNLTRAQLISKDAVYGTDQNGAIVYVTTVNGTVSTKTTKITKVGYYYFDGSLWQPFLSTEAVIPTEPWQVQGGTTAASTNAQNIYQTGSVAIGSNTAGTYKFQVTGTSNITGNSRVASSTVTGNQTVGGTLGVTGATTLSNTLGVTGATSLSSTLGVAGAATIASTGSFTLAGNGAAASRYLMSDASGKGTWTALPTTATTEPWQVQGGTTVASTNAQNIYQTGSVAIGSNTAGSYKFQVTGTSNITGNSRVASSTVTGNQTVGGTFTVGSETNLPEGALFGVQTLAPNEGLVNSTKGFMYPRVTLINNLSLEPMLAGGGTTGEKLQHSGLTVYHIGGSNLEPGLYVWNGVQWLMLITQIPIVTSVIADLKTSGYIPFVAYNQPHLGQALDFGALDIKEDGSYALLLRFYGQVHEDRTGKRLTSMASTSIYVWVYRSGVSTPIDAAELSFTLPPYGSGTGQGTHICAFTAALTVPDAKLGETLSIRIGTSPAFTRFNLYLEGGEAPNAARTSLYYWKL